MIYSIRLVDGLKKVLTGESSVVPGVSKILLTMDGQMMTGFWMVWEFLCCVTVS